MIKKKDGRIPEPSFFFLVFLSGFAFIPGGENGYEKREDDPHHNQRFHQIPLSIRLSLVVYSHAVYSAGPRAACDPSLSAFIMTGLFRPCQLEEVHFKFNLKKHRKGHLRID